MTFDVPHEYEQVINQLVASGAFTSSDEALHHALGLLADDLQTPVSHSVNEDPQQWSERFRRWAAAHPANDHFVDASRDGIYEGRGH